MDINELYILNARNRYGNRGEFHVGDISEDPNIGMERFDLVITTGVLHHLDDEQSKTLIKYGMGKLKPGGRFITLDNVDGENIGVINKIALKLDRGQFIRNKATYLQLFTDYPQVKCNVVQSDLRIPYRYIICEIVQKEIPDE